MKLYQIYNGYMSNGPVFVIVIAADEEQAKRLASDKFKEHRPRQHETYWTNADVIVLAEDTNVDFVSEVEEG